MATVKFKVESGIQLLARLRKRPDIENFYPLLFETGPKQGDIIEITSDSTVSSLLIDVIAEALIPTVLGGVDAGVLIFSTDGNINFDLLSDTLRRKLLLRITNSSHEQKEITDEEFHNLFHSCLSNLHIMEIYDSTQFYTSLHNLDSILIDNSNISLIVLHTLTAFYWSEQGFKITKMDVYLKNLLRLLQKNCKEYKVTIFYTRPEYFSSSKELLEKSDGCPKQPTLEHVNFRVHILSTGDNSYQANVKSISKLHSKTFNIVHNEIKWI